MSTEVEEGMRALRGMRQTLFSGQRGELDDIAERGGGGGGGERNKFEEEEKKSRYTLDDYSPPLGGDDASISIQTAWRAHFARKAARESKFFIAQSINSSLLLPMRGKEALDRCETRDINFHHEVLVHHVQELRRSVEKKFGGLEDLKQANLSSDSLEWEGHPSRGGHDPVSTPSNHLPPSEEIEMNRMHISISVCLTPLCPFWVSQPCPDVWSKRLHNLTIKFPRFTELISAGELYGALQILLDDFLLALQTGNSTRSLALSISLASEYIARMMIASGRPHEAVDTLNSILNLIHNRSGLMTCPGHHLIKGMLYDVISQSYFAQNQMISALYFSEKVREHATEVLREIFHDLVSIWVGHEAVILFNLGFTEDALDACERSSRVNSHTPACSDTSSVSSAKSLMHGSRLSRSKSPMGMQSKRLRPLGKKGQTNVSLRSSSQDSLPSLAGSHSRSSMAGDAASVRSRPVLDESSPELTSSSSLLSLMAHGFPGQSRFFRSNAKAVHCFNVVVLNLHAFYVSKAEKGLHQAQKHLEILNNRSFSDDGEEIERFVNLLSEMLVCLKKVRISSDGSWWKRLQERLRSSQGSLSGLRKDGANALARIKLLSV
ncbi:hypothetical protein GUITHDRAFT_102858 [Guillardia theta CCMP2712]|uniref:Uncharacterized protein n=1 Tax=Guillardia theta (strain CCMP2712) TaxID=905079 RepID=L1JT28_GUITC|nr:hypothetical protein GUITHDRAFT_102858 [Guillardia theta CCMP2712]EKX51597.1 hypothetical protein GUITHDRAFT_102858 [Guillardia theta CCMP2712]|eukprot:XP_005838577.1 hypothetical protein GUITHDRAFT_102858 [Guillardia theta CCMP2712]